MALRSSSLSTRFFVALIVLIVALAGIGAVGFDGLVRVQRANDQVYSDNYLTEEATSEVAVALSRVETLSARLATAPDASQAARLRAELEFVAVPRANRAISRLVALHRIDPPEELRTIARIPAQWKQFQADLARHERNSGRAVRTRPARGVRLRAAVGGGERGSFRSR